jgi:hypothetical protein
MVGDSRPPRNYRNGRGFCREDQLADCNPTSDRKSCRAGQPVSSGLFGRSLRSGNRRDGISRGHCSRDKRHENPCLQADPNYLVSCRRKALRKIFGETRPKISDQRRFPRPRGVTSFARFRRLAEMESTCDSQQRSIPDYHCLHHSGLDGRLNEGFADCSDGRHPNWA